MISRATPFKYRTRQAGPVERPVSLSGDELAAAMNASRDLPYEKRNLFLQRLFAQLQLSGTVTIDVAIQRALTGLQHR